MTAKNFYLVLTACVGIVGGGALSQAHRLDAMTSTLKNANAKVSASIEARKKRTANLGEVNVSSTRGKKISKRKEASLPNIADLKGGQKPDGKLLPQTAVVDSTKQDSLRGLPPVDSSQHKKGQSSPKPVPSPQKPYSISKATFTHQDF